MPRNEHSSTTIHTNLIVVGGINSASDRLYSIEILDLSVRDDLLQWEILEV